MSAMLNENSPHAEASGRRECQTSGTSVSVSLNEVNGEKILLQNLSEHVKIKLPSRPLQGKETMICAFWDETSQNISKEGCKLTNVSNTTFCECNHTTDFLMEFLPPPPLVPQIKWGRLEPENMIRNPMPSVLMGGVVLLLFFLFLFALRQDKNDKVISRVTKKKKRMGVSKRIVGSRRILLDRVQK